MLLGLVLTVVSLAFADAGYQYNAPTASLSSPGNQPATFQTGQRLQQHTVLPNVQDRPLSHSISYKDYVYLKQDNDGYGRSAVTNTAGTFSKNGYVNTDYALRFAPVVNLNNNFATISNNLNKGNIHNFVPIINGNANGGYVNGGYAQSGSNSNGYAQFFVSPSAISFNSAGLSQGYTQTAIPSISGNLNSEYLRSLAPARSASSIHDVSQNQVASGSSNTNIGYSNSGIVRNGYSQVSISSSSGGSNIGSSQKSSALANSHIGNIKKFTSPANGKIDFLNADSINAVIGNSKPISGSNRSPIAPAVFKHIYVHVAPTDAEEQNVIPSPPPPKKNYKILFIKVPSQGSQSNLVRSQQLPDIRNAASLVQYKTLIYVLVKNPEAQQPIVPKPTPSKHEVFFVKYKDNPLDITAQVNEKLEKTGSVQRIIPLQPGLVNGQS